jgi:hypothetical protein
MQFCMLVRTWCMCRRPPAHLHNGIIGAKSGELSAGDEQLRLKRLPQQPAQCGTLGLRKQHLCHVLCGCMSSRPFQLHSCPKPAKTSQSQAASSSSVAGPIGASARAEGLMKSNATTILRHAVKSAPYGLAALTKPAFQPHQSSVAQMPTHCSTAARVWLNKGFGRFTDTGA